jgi:hypothetical protein
MQENTSAKQQAQALATKRWGSSPCDAAGVRRNAHHRRRNLRAGKRAGRQVSQFSTVKETHHATRSNRPCRG